MTGTKRQSRILRTVAATSAAVAIAGALAAPTVAYTSGGACPSRDRFYRQADIDWLAAEHGVPVPLLVSVDANGNGLLCWAGPLPGPEGPGYLFIQDDFVPLTTQRS